MSHAFIGTQLASVNQESKDYSDFIKFVCKHGPRPTIFNFPKETGTTAHLQAIKDFFGQADIEHMAISKDSAYMALRGKHPIIYLDLAVIASKVNGSPPNIAQEIFAAEISELYCQFLSVREGLSPSYQLLFNKYVNKKATLVELQASLVKLMLFIEKQSNLKTILLIDGYERALDNPLLKILDTFFRCALKDEYHHLLCVAMGSLVDLDQNSHVACRKLFPDNSQFYCRKDASAARYFIHAQPELKMAEVVPPVLAVPDEDPTQVMSSTTEPTLAATSSRRP